MSHQRSAQAVDTYDDDDNEEDEEEEERLMGGTMGGVMTGGTITDNETEE
jgi:hypothetical protein